MNLPTIKPLADHYLTGRLLSIRLCVGLRTIYRMVDRGQLPPPIVFGRKLVRWRWGAVVLHLRQWQRRQEAAAAV